MHFSLSMKGLVWTCQSESDEPNLLNTTFQPFTQPTEIDNNMPSPPVRLCQPTAIVQTLLFTVLPDERYCVNS